MPLELAVWRIDGEFRAVAASGLALEGRLETLLDQDVAIANPGWMVVIGRPIDTGFGGRAVARSAGGTPPQDPRSGLAFLNRVLGGPAPF